MANNNQALGTQATPDYMKSMYQAYLGENYKPGEGQTWETIAEHHKTHGTSLVGLTDWLEKPETLSSAYPEQQGQVKLQDSGFTQFVPESSDNIDISDGEASLLQGGQSNWFKTFQDAYVSGQATIQKSIADLMKQQADITQETREGYQDTIDEAKTGLEEAKDKPYGEELGEELSEKYKLQEKIDKLGEIGNQMAQLQGAYDASVAQTEISGITVGQSRGELARKQREYASKTSVLQAKSAVITDQYNLVSDIVEKYYNSAESERTAEISRYQNLLDVATKAKLSLTSDDKDMITTQINLLRGEQSKQEANKDKIMALAIDPNTAEAFFSSGASLDDTYEQILEKMSPYMSAYAKAKRLGDTTIDTEPTNIWTAPDGTEIDPLTIEGVKYFVNEGNTYGEMFSWYDTNTKLTTTAIKALFKSAELEETEIIDDVTISRLSAGFLAEIIKDSSVRERVNAMLDKNKIVNKGLTYELTQKQSDEIRKAIRKPITKVWDWIKGTYR